MNLLIKNVKVFDGKTLNEKNVLVENGFVAAVGGSLTAGDGVTEVQADGLVLAPGFIDLHTHLRQPGFEEKETIATGTAAAAAGGFTTVCSMPNLNPVPDNLHGLDVQLQAITKDAKVRVLPYGSVTAGQQGACLSDISVLSEFVCGFSDDGYGVQSDKLMQRAMDSVAEVNSLLKGSHFFIASHAEDESLLPENGVCVQAGSPIAKQLDLAGYSNESEWEQVSRDIALAKETKCPLHICHASCAETYELVRVAKKKGLPVTCEATPHNLVFSCEDIPGDDGNFKMNPPLRGPQDVAAAVHALADGTIDAVATDHAPHTAEQKAGAFSAGGANGVVGLETAFPALFTHLVLAGKISLETLLTRFTTGPADVLGETAPRVGSGKPANLVLLDLETERTVDPEEFLSKGRSTPFAGQALRGWPVMTIYRGEIVYQRPGTQLV